MSDFLETKSHSQSVHFTFQSEYRDLDLMTIIICRRCMNEDQNPRHLVIEFCQPKNQFCITRWISALKELGIFSSSVQLCCTHHLLSTAANMIVIEGVFRIFVLYFSIVSTSWSICCKPQETGWKRRFWALRPSISSGNSKLAHLGLSLKCSAKYNTSCLLSYSTACFRTANTWTTVLLNIFSLSD